jgi:hypothetical protein
MKAEITLTSKKKYVMEYDDNDFSDEVLIDNFWLWEFDESEFVEHAKLTLKRTHINEKPTEE